MKTEANFPTDITTEERDSGFRLVATTLPFLDSGTYGVRSQTVIAVKPLEPGWRLVKMAAIKLRASDTGVSYQLHSFGVDPTPMNRYPGVPSWRTMWLRPVDSLAEAVRRFQTEPRDANWQVAPEPEEEVVSAECH